MIDFLLQAMGSSPERLAVAELGGTYTCGDLSAAVDRARTVLRDADVGSGRVVSLEAEYGLEAVAAFLALTDARAVLVPMSHSSRAHHASYFEVAQVESRARIVDGSLTIEETGQRADHAMYDTLRERGHPGLVLFSSGSTGAPKAAVHDLERLLRKFHQRKRAYRTIVFLQLDHIGGVNTLFYTLSNGGAIIVPHDRSPAGVCQAIETHRAELLPTSPTFLNLLLLSGEHQRHDLSSLKLVTYGTEPMPASTLAHVAEAFPNLKLQQTYGLTEVGILRSESRGSDSLWVRVGGEGYETRVVDGRLWIRAESAMLGYLNAPSPFSEDGFLNTGDLVETDGEWLRILGRQSDVINVGGSKVYPAEVESVLLALPNVVDAVVHGQANAITGQIVAATVRLGAPEPLADFKLRMRVACRERLEAYKIPVSWRVTSEPLHSERYKRMR